MPKEFEYSVTLFTYQKDKNAFVADEKILFVVGFKQCFPNAGKQFYIKNHITGNRRRFRLLKENNEQYEFISDDSIKCIINKNKTV